MISYEISGNLVRMVGRGRVSRADIDAALNSIVAMPSFVPASRLLILDEDSDYTPDPDRIEETASRLGQRRHQFLRMAVVVSEEVKYGLGRMLEAYIEPQGKLFRVFRDEEEAVRWLATG